MIVDSHCHLHFDEFKDDLDDVLKRAFDTNVLHMLLIGTKLNDIAILKELHSLYPNLSYSIGIHPHESKDYSLQEIKEAFTKDLGAIGIGETGLDYHYMHSPKETQIDSFNLQIELSIQKNLPLIIHTRNAYEDTIACLKSYPKSKGVFHCFSGSKEFAKSALDLGFKISFSGIITFLKATELHKVVAYVPLEEILIETDAPFLAPIPYRGKRNEPAFIVQVAKRIAELKNISFEEVACKTTQNFSDLFKVKGLDKLETQQV